MTQDTLTFPADLLLSAEEQENQEKPIYTKKAGTVSLNRIRINGNRPGVLDAIAVPRFVRKQNAGLEFRIPAEEREIISRQWVRDLRSNKKGWLPILSGQPPQIPFTARFSGRADI